MSDIKHTPERWFWTETSDDRPQMLMRSLSGGAPDYVLTPQADLSDYGLSLNPWVEISAKDQRLIEATPLLLNALRDAIPALEHVCEYADDIDGTGRKRLDAARAAIAAATGDA